MKTAEEWYHTEGGPSLHNMVTCWESDFERSEVVDYIRKIQSDALQEASLIASAAKVPSGTKDWNDGYHLATRSISDRLREEANKLRPLNCLVNLPG